MYPMIHPIHRPLAVLLLLSGLFTGIASAAVLPPAHSPVPKTAVQAVQGAPVQRRRRPIPQFTTHFTQTHPASLHPTLRWKPILGTVYYRVQVWLPSRKSGAMYPAAAYPSPKGPGAM